MNRLTRTDADSLLCLAALRTAEVAAARAVALSLSADRRPDAKLLEKKEEGAED